MRPSTTFGGSRRQTWAGSRNAVPVGSNRVLTRSVEPRFVPGGPMAVRRNFTEHRIVWLVTGMVFGLALAYYWPHEPAHASDVALGDKFAMCTAETLAGNSEAIFVLDFTTGRLLGARLQHADRLVHTLVRTQCRRRLQGGRGCSVRHRSRPGESADHGGWTAGSRRALHRRTDVGTGVDVRLPVRTVGPAASPAAVAAAGPASVAAGVPLRRKHNQHNVFVIRSGVTGVRSHPSRSFFARCQLTEYSDGR